MKLHGHDKPEMVSVTSNTLAGALKFAPIQLAFNKGLRTSELKIEGTALVGFGSTQ